MLSPSKPLGPSPRAPPQLPSLSVGMASEEGPASDHPSTNRHSAFKGLVESLQRRHAFAPANTTDVLIASSASVALAKREEAAAEQLAACREFVESTRARAAMLATDLGGKSAALEDAIEHDASAKFVQHVATDVDAKRLELLQDEMDVGVYGGLADAAELLNAVDTRCAKAIVALAYDGPFVVPPSFQLTYDR